LSILSFKETELALCFDSDFNFYFELDCGVILISNFFFIDMGEMSQSSNFLCCLTDDKLEDIVDLSAVDFISEKESTSFFLTEVFWAV